MSKVFHTLRYDVCKVVVFLTSDQASPLTSQTINVPGRQEMR